MAESDEAVRVFGAFSVMQRTDGQWIVYDDRRPLGKKTVRVFRYLKEAIAAASAWQKLGHG